MRTPFFLVLAALSLFAAAPAAQSDLDAFMQRVLARRDENWAKLQQYTLEEDERFQVVALDGRKFYGFRREYHWYPEDGVFIRSPTAVDGMRVDEDDRRKAEREWRQREVHANVTRAAEAENRTRPNSQQADARSSSAGATEPAGATPAGSQASDDDTRPSLEDIVAPGNQPRFISSAYFMKFKFDPGHYALAGREQLLGRDVYRIEYYPTRLFQDDDQRREERRNRDAREQQADEKMRAKMNKVALVTLWVEPKEHQILQYEFENIDFDFMPARGVVRLDDLRASMRMAEPFPGVWLPDTIAMRFGMSLAMADVAASYDVRYHRYTLAEVKARIQ